MTGKKSQYAAQKFDLFQKEYKWFVQTCSNVKIGTVTVCCTTNLILRLGANQL